MCMEPATVKALHAVTTELAQINDERDEWIAHRGECEFAMLSVNQAEAEMIFTKRREVIEAKLKELGWSKTTRVEPSNGDAK